MQQWKLRSFCPRLANAQIHPAEFHATRYKDKILSYNRTFFCKKGQVTGEKLVTTVQNVPVHVLATFPLVSANLKSYNFLALI